MLTFPGEFPVSVTVPVRFFPPRMDPSERDSPASCTVLAGSISSEAVCVSPPACAVMVAVNVAATVEVATLVVAEAWPWGMAICEFTCAAPLLLRNPTTNPPARATPLSPTVNVALSPAFRKAGDSVSVAIRRALAASRFIWNVTTLAALLSAMLEKRDQWMHDFVLDRAPDWDELRTRLERPFALVAASDPSSSRYSEEEWQIVRACFTLLCHAAAQLKVVFAEAATADYIEVAQIALNVLRGDDGLPTDGAQAVADGIRHLLVDEFQDTSRRQHQLLAYLIAAWPEREGRTCFVVGDPMQSIYFFRDADAELFPRVEQLGLEIPGDLPLRFDSVQLSANPFTSPSVVDNINGAFTQIFAIDDGSGVTYAQAEPARDGAKQPGPHLVAEPAPRLQLHLEFVPESPRGNSRSLGPDRKKEIAAEREAAQQKHIEEIVALIRSHMAHVDRARAANGKYRIAVLGRARKSLEPIAAALRDASIPFRAVELEKLQDRPEIIDVLALARALLNPHDRVSWL